MLNISLGGIIVYGDGGRVNRKIEYINCAPF